MIRLLSHSRGPREIAELPDSLFEAQALLQELLASWHSRTPAVERRQGHRRPAGVMVKFAPWDDVAERALEPVEEVRVKDVSPRGVALIHDEPIAHRKIMLTFRSRAGEEISLVVRLKWCRFKRTGVYESGGQFVRRLPAPPQSPDAA